jgi:hypothetical protein
LPTFKNLEERMRKWVKENGKNKVVEPNGQKTVVWFHNESMFYANDRQRSRWVQKNLKRQSLVSRVKGHL